MLFPSRRMVRRAHGNSRKGKEEMARKNRVVVEDGLYHVTTRIAHRERLLADPEVKALVEGWMYGIADFCGVCVDAWSIMDNHLHIYLEVPSVPERYWTDPGTVPPTAARSMRPAECRDPRWSPDMADRDYAVSPAGERPSEAALARAAADGVPVVTLPRPPTGFAMSDAEMVRRLERLHSGQPGRAKRTAARWAALRAEGRGGEVDAEKDALCRRMYNVSQYMKTLKQRISEHFNRERGHSGALWEGRFRSSLVDRDGLSELYVSSYIEWNAPRAGIVGHPREWRWCSYATACGDGPYAARAREGYARLFGSWEDAKARLDAVFADRLPDSYDPARDGFSCEGRDGEGRPCRVMLRMAQLVKVVSPFFRAAYFSRDVAYARRVLGSLPGRFPAPGDGCLRRLARFGWDGPGEAAA